MKPKPPHEAGELHRRVNAILQSGILPDLPKAAVVTFLQCRQWADFKTCRFNASLRTLAKHCGFSNGSASRGLGALLEVGVVVEVPSRRQGCRTFEVRKPSRMAVQTRDDRGQRGRPWGDATPDGDLE
jgi:hypothetical protein